MKHLKLFENRRQEFWLFDYHIKDNHEHSYYLFPDKESAENSIIMTINNERQELETNSWSDEMFFTEMDEAMDWYEKNFNEIEIRYDRITLSSHYDGGEELRKHREIKKYNL